MTQINPIVPNAPFLYPVKTSENCKGVEKGCIGDEWVNLRILLSKIRPEYYLADFNSYGK